MKTVLVSFFLALLRLAPVSQAETQFRVTPFIGVLEWGYSQNDLQNLKPWIQDLSENREAQAACGEMIGQGAPDSTQTRHAGRVLSSLLTGHFDSPPLSVEDRERVPTGLHVLPISFTDGAMASPSELARCLDSLTNAGMILLTSSIGTPPNPKIAKLNQLIGSAFRNFLAAHPQVPFTLAAGNDFVPLESFSGAPQSLCAEKIDNLYCVTVLERSVSNELEAMAAGVDSALLAKKYASPFHVASGTELDPYQLFANYLGTSPNIASTASTSQSSETAPLFARFLYRNRGCDFSRTGILKKMKTVWAVARPGVRLLPTYEF